MLEGIDGLKSTEIYKSSLKILISIKGASTQSGEDIFQKIVNFSMILSYSTTTLKILKIGKDSDKICTL